MIFGNVPNAVNTPTDITAAIIWFSVKLEQNNPIEMYTNDNNMYPIKTFSVVMNSGFPKYINIK